MKRSRKGGGGYIIRCSEHTFANIFTLVRALQCQYIDSHNDKWDEDYDDLVCIDFNDPNVKIVMAKMTKATAIV